MKQKDAYERIRQIKEVVVDNGSMMLVPKAILHRTILFSSLISLLNFGITPFIFLIDGVTMGYRILLAAVVMIGSSGLFYFYTLRILQDENDRLQRPYTKNQRFIGQIYTVVTAIGMTMSLTVSVFGGYSTIFFYWIALVGAALFVFGHYTLRAIKLYGLFLIISGLLLIVGCAFYFAPSAIGLGRFPHDIETSIYFFGQFCAVLLSGVGQLGLWVYLRRHDV